MVAEEKPEIDQANLWMGRVNRVRNGKVGGRGTPASLGSVL